MTLTIIPNLIQGGEEWLAARRGLVTASVVGQLLSIGRLGGINYQCPACTADALDPCQSKVNGKPIKTLHPERTEFAATQESPPVVEVADNDTSRGLTRLLVAERITGWTEDTYMNDAMWRGVEDEPIARDKYREHYAPVTEVGFMTEDRWGYRIGFSPDGLVGEEGLIEIKSRSPKAQLATILADQVPTENMAQLMCGLLVSGREWLDYVSFCGGMPMFVKRVYPDQQWFDAITQAVATFETTAAEMIDTYHMSIAGLHMTERTTIAQGLVI